MSSTSEQIVSRTQELLNHTVAAIVVACSAYTILSLLRIHNLPAGTLPMVAALSVALTVVVVVKLFKGLLDFHDAAIAVRYAVFLAIVSVASNVTFVWCVQAMMAQAPDDSKAEAQACSALTEEDLANRPDLRELCAKYVSVNDAPN